MFLPNQNCRIQLSSGKTDVYGQPTPSTFVRERCTVVKLVITNEKSSIRADSSASRGNAMELEAESVILLPKTTKARIDDIIEVENCKLRIMGLSPRRDLQGRLDHYRITAHFWSK